MMKWLSFGRSQTCDQSKGKAARRGRRGRWRSDPTWGGGIQPGEQCRVDVIRQQAEHLDRGLSWWQPPGTAAIRDDQRRQTTNLLNARVLDEGHAHQAIRRQHTGKQLAD